jgi:hypothetical protein
MRRWSLIAVISLTSLAVAQHTGGSPFSSDLVLWSHMQQPQQPEQSQDRPHQAPTPEPTPDTQPAQNPTPPEPGQSTPAKAPETAKQASTAQAFVGTINRQGDNFLLKISETIGYKLDNHSDVQQYEGKRVRVTGTLDTSANLIHVDKVEPLT